MLEIRPSCEHCDRDLPPHSTEARICSFECTFCAACVETVLDNVCPNCGGGFVPRPVRPAHQWRTGVSCAHQPPDDRRTYKPVDAQVHRSFIATVRNIPPEKR
jgi:hypothetical protein